MSVEKVAELLQRAEEERRPMDPISSIFPEGLTLEDAYEICERNVRRRTQRGEQVAGYKVGLTNMGVRKQMGFPDSTYGFLMENMVLQGGGTFDTRELIAPKIECEICFKLRADLGGKDVPPEKVLESTEGVCASFEICDTRLREWKCSYEEFFADNGCSARVVLSGDWHPVDTLDLLNETVVLYKGEDPIADGRGELAMGHPARAIAWLAGKLAERGRSLQAGQIIMTGTLTPMMVIEKSSRYRAKFSTLGPVEMTFL